MENNKSFSLQFNPLTNVKCVKDYEEEIAQLKTENFDLKAQLTHTNLPKVLYENKQEVDSLLSQKQNLQNAFENLKREYENLQQEKRLQENKFNQELLMSNERNSLLEDENKRLVLRMEKFNKEIQETGMAKNELNELRMNIQNLEKRNEQNMYDYERHFSELKEQYENMKIAADEEIKCKNFEIENLKNKLEAAIQRERNGSFIISDLKATLNTQVKDKAIFDNLQNEKQELENQLKNSQEIIEKTKKDQIVYFNGMEKFRTAILQKLFDISKALVDLNEKLFKFKTFCFISDENKSLISKLKIKYSNLNELIGFFKEKHAEIYRKMDVLRKEATSNGNKGGIDLKTQAILQEFRNQFGEAKNELMICKKYLEKKSIETKELKLENGKLLAELQKYNKNYTNAFNKINMMKI